MNFNRTLLGLALAASCAALLAGCSSYYKVRDTASGRDYYTTDVDRSGSAVRFKDGKTGNNVTLQNSEITEIPSDVYKQAISSPSTGK
jgi:hypothetical protein